MGIVDQCQCSRSFRWEFGIYLTNFKRCIVVIKALASIVDKSFMVMFAGYRLAINERNYFIADFLN